MGQRITPSDDAVDHIRPVQLADAPELADLLTIMGYPCDTAEAERRLIELEHDDRQLLLVAERAGLVCALLGLDFGFQVSLGGNTCRLTALAVDPEQQRSGVGRSLLREAENRARHGGCTRIEVSSAASREAVHALLRDAGYREGSVRFVKGLGDA